MTDVIHNFTSSHIAFFRPIRRTYYVLHWNNERRRWCKFVGDLPNLVLKRSSVSVHGRVGIHVAKNQYSPTREINVLAQGYYMTSGTTYITIVKNESHALQPLFMETEFTLSAEATTGLIITTRALWSIAPPAPAAPVPPTELQTTPLKPIPQRIAWLIAEGASKNKESCPITSEEISPVTAAVTTCFHVFENDAIREWFNRNPVKTKCPMCREVCLMTAAFSQ